MAGHADNRDFGGDIKYLHSVLTRMDEGIPVPRSVGGDALRAKLDNVYPTVAAAPNTRSGFKLNYTRWLGWRSGFSYAVAFTLIVCIFYGLGFDRQPQSIVDGTGTLRHGETEEDLLHDPQARMDGGTEDDQTPQVYHQQLPEAAGFDAGVQETAPDMQEESADGDIITPFSMTEGVADSEDADVGGGSITLMTQPLAGYTYTWRTNDPTDPDKGIYPITIDVVSDATDAAVAQVDLEDVFAVRDSYLYGDVLAFTGYGDVGIMTKIYNVANPVEPYELDSIVNPGIYINARLYENTLHVVTYSDNPELIQSETEALPDSTLEGFCIVTAIDLASSTETGWYQKAFSGASEDVTLHNVNAYITYAGVDEEGEPSTRIAQIRLEGTDISLGGIS